MVSKLSLMKAKRPKLIHLAGKFAIGASGAVASESGARLSGATVTQTGSEDGRYAVAFDRTYAECISATCNMVGPDDSAFPTATGSNPELRLLDETGFSVQFKRQDTEADADPASGTVCTWSAVVRLG
jgi:hypothetical protein